MEIWNLVGYLRFIRELLIQQLAPVSGNFTTEIDLRK